MPRNQYGSKRLEIDEPGKLGFALVDTEGNPLANRKLEVGLYRVNWRWWWDENDGSLSDYSSANHYNADDKTTVTTNSKGEAEWTVTMSDWGRYMVRVCDSQTGHCSGDFFYAGYPWYNDEGFDRQEAAMLAFTSSKSTYNVGETVELKVPGSAQSRILLSLENGSGVLDASWKPGQAGENSGAQCAQPRAGLRADHNAFAGSQRALQHGVRFAVAGTRRFDVENVKGI